MPLHSMRYYQHKNNMSMKSQRANDSASWWYFGIGIGPMIMGIILQWTSYPIMFLCLTFIGVLNSLYFYYAIGKKRGKR